MESVKQADMEKGAKTADSGLSFSSKEIRKELERVKNKHRYRRFFYDSAATLITVAAIAVLVATLWLPVLRVYGSSMNPTLTEGDLIVSLKGSDFKQGDIIAFYYNNKILVKRVIAVSGQWVDMNSEGNVYVNNELIDEPYISEFAYGETDIELPYQVPEGRIFVMGDNRLLSVDSRNSAIGCVSEEQIVGKLTFCIWPLKSFGSLKQKEG